MTEPRVKVPVTRSKPKSSSQRKFKPTGVSRPVPTIPKVTRAQKETVLEEEILAEQMELDAQLGALSDGLGLGGLSGAGAGAGAGVGAPGGPLVAAESDDIGLPTLLRQLSADARENRVSLAEKLSIKRALLSDDDLVVRCVSIHPSCSRLLTECLCVFAGTAWPG